MFSIKNYGNEEKKNVNKIKSLKIYSIQSSPEKNSFESILMAHRQKNTAHRTKEQYNSDKNENMTEKKITHETEKYYLMKAKIQINWHFEHT